MDGHNDRIAGGPNPPVDTRVIMKTDEKSPLISPPPSTSSTGSFPLKIATTDAVLLALKNNRSLAVEQLTPSIQKTFKDAERAVFDPLSSIEITSGRTDGERLASAGSGIEDFVTNDALGVISLEQYFLTGTTVTFFNRAPKSNYRRAMLNWDQAVEALENLSQLVELGVRAAYVEVNRAREQIKASATTRHFSEETLRIKTE